MLPRLVCLDAYKHWKGPTGYFAPTALRHPERLTWAFAWNEGNNRGMAERPRPVHDPQALYQEDLQNMWWPVLVDTTSSHLLASPSGNGLPGICPPQIENGSQAWWCDVPGCSAPAAAPSRCPSVRSISRHSPQLELTVRRHHRAVLTVRHRPG